MATLWESHMFLQLYRAVDAQSLDTFPRRSVGQGNIEWVCRRPASREAQVDLLPTS
jgi:hypothetical protein